MWHDDDAQAIPNPENADSQGAASGLKPQAPAEETVSPEELAGELERARAALEKLQAEKDELFQSLVRLQADFDNFRKRTARERREDAARHTAALVESLLPVLDAFERAFASEAAKAHEETRKGFELVYRQLTESLARHGLERIPALGQAFDPHVHEAVDRVETQDAPDGTVLEELSGGYRVRGRVVRPSMVRVAVAPAGASPAKDSLVN
jgi:molecular chaperone GrpE